MAERASVRRRPWAAALCFVCCRGDGEPRGKQRRPKERKLRAVPAPADGSAEDDQEVRRGEDGAAKVSLLRTFCCFLPPARTHQRKGSSPQQKQEPCMPAPSPGPRTADDDPSAESPPAWHAEQRIVASTTTAEIVVIAAAGTTPGDADADGSSGEALPVAARAGGATEAAYFQFQGEFAPAVGLCVVAAASTAGLLGGRLLGVVAFVCTWLFALWIRRRRRLAPGTGSKASEQR